jgi:hypothetical protein
LCSFLCKKEKKMYWEKTGSGICCTNSFHIRIYPSPWQNTSFQRILYWDVFLHKNF